MVGITNAWKISPEFCTILVSEKNEKWSRISYAIVSHTVGYPDEDCFLIMLRVHIKWKWVTACTDLPHLTWGRSGIVHKELAFVPPVLGHSKSSHVQANAWTGLTSAGFFGLRAGKLEGHLAQWRLSFTLTIEKDMWQLLFVVSVQSSCNYKMR